MLKLQKNSCHLYNYSEVAYMRKYLVLMLVMGFVISACGNETAESDPQEEGASEEETANEDSAEGETDEVTSESIIDEAINQYEDTVSYEMRQDYIISNESEEEINVITTRSEEEELKIDLNTPAGTSSHYIINEEHIVYSDGEFENQDGDVNIEGSTYGDLTAQLESFRDAELAEVEEGYELTKNISNVEEVNEFLPDDISSEIADTEVEGSMTVQFNSDYQFNGVDMELTLDDGEEHTLTSTGTISRIGQIDLLEKPNAMSE